MNDDEKEFDQEDPDVIDAAWNPKSMQMARPAEPPAPISLLAIAIQKGVDADQLDKLLAMQERYEKNQAEKAFNAAMTRCQKAMPTIVKDKENKHTKQRYASLEGILEIARPVYSEAGFALSFTEEESKLSNHVRLVCLVSHDGGCTRRFEGDFPIDAGGMRGGDNKTAIQAKGSTITYAKRYLVCMAFNLTIADQEPESEATARIGPGQVKEINDLIHEIYDANLPFDMAKFLKWVKAGSVIGIPLRDFRKVVSELERKLKEKK